MHSAPMSTQAITSLLDIKSGAQTTEGRSGAGVLGYIAWLSHEGIRPEQILPICLLVFGWAWWTMWRTLAKNKAVGEVGDVADAATPETRGDLLRPSTPPKSPQPGADPAPYLRER